MSQKVIFVFKNEYLFVDETCTKCSTGLEIPVQLCVQMCRGREAPNNRWNGDNATCNQPGHCGEWRNVEHAWN